MATFTHYYVQSVKDNSLPELVYHSKDEETGELYHKFLDKTKAVNFMMDEKLKNPNTKFRVVKCIENYIADTWI